MELEELKQSLCLSCMECCKTIIVPTFYSIATDRQTIDLFEMRGIEVKRGVAGPVLLIPCSCQYLSDDGCRIYDSRPDVCKDYDGRKVRVMEDVCKWHRIVKIRCHSCDNVFYSSEELSETTCSKCGSTSSLSMVAA